MANVMFAAHFDQIEKLRVHGYQVHAKWLRSQLLRFSNLRIEQFRRHRTAGDYTKAASVRDRRDEVALRNPAHRTAKDCVFTAEKFCSAPHEGGSFRELVHARRLGAEMRRGKTSRNLAIQEYSKVAPE